MTVNIFKDRLQHAKLFGKPVLTTSGIITVETADGPCAELGRAVPPKSGPLHIVCDLPKGRLKNAAAPSLWRQRRTKQFS